MKYLPSIKGKIKLKSDHSLHYIPDEDEFLLFWENFYAQLNSLAYLYPVQDSPLTINPYTGYFGLRWHPVKKQAKYFHAGIDIDIPKGTAVVCCFDGIFEYAGYGDVNGMYSMISHPSIQTIDGWVLNSLYLHLSLSKFHFPLIEKCLRKISFNHLPVKRIMRGDVIGFSGESGIAKGYPHLHFQLEFRKGNESVLMDPCRILNIVPRKNLSENVQDEAEFNSLLKM